MLTAKTQVPTCCCSVGTTDRYLLDGGPTPHCTCTIDHTTGFGHFCTAQPAARQIHQMLYLTSVCYVSALNFYQNDLLIFQIIEVFLGWGRVAAGVDSVYLAYSDYRYRRREVLQTCQGARKTLGSD